MPNHKFISPRSRILEPREPLLSLLLICVTTAGALNASEHVFCVNGDQITINARPFKAIGLRCSNALISDAEADELIGQFDTYNRHGINIVSVFVMGSRFGDLQGYRPDGTIEPAVADRLVRVVRQADQRGMVVIVGCLYWSVSTASKKLQFWTQEHAERAVANTTKLLVENNLRNVFIDVDNEGMARDKMKFDIADLIDASHRVNSNWMVAFNDRRGPIATNADLYIHHSPRVPGRPWLDSEATPQKTTPRSYWGDFSKDAYRADNDFYNYSRIGRYTPRMKREQLQRTLEEVRGDNGHMLASTWLQCGTAGGIEGIEGPRHDLGGLSQIDDVHADANQLHPDAGVRWWAEFVRATFGAWDSETLRHTGPIATTPLPGNADTLMVDIETGLGTSLLKASDESLITRGMSAVQNARGRVLHAITLDDERTRELSGKDTSQFEFKSVSLPACHAAVHQVTFTPAKGKIGRSVAALMGSSSEAGSLTRSATKRRRPLQLRGLSQRAWEGENEPPLSDVLWALGFDVNIGWTKLPSDTKPALKGDEISPSGFTRAGDAPVRLIPLARYSPPFALPFGVADMATPAAKNKPVLIESEVGVLSGHPKKPEHQTLYPAICRGNVLVKNPPQLFGVFNVSPTHRASTSDAVNKLRAPKYIAHAARIYPACDQDGERLENQYMICFEEARNGDYQDYVWVRSA